MCSIACFGAFSVLVFFIVCFFLFLFFFKQKSAYEMRSSDWSSDVCSSDLADPPAVIESFERKPSFTGRPHKVTHMLCTNPITGAFNGSAPASANRGTLDARDADKPTRIVPGIVPARCDTSGVLMIGEPVDMGPFTLPGNNYHVYDYALFWADVREDARQRLAAFLKK